MKFRTQCTFKNVKVEIQSKYRKESTQTKGSVSRTFPDVFQEFGKTPEIAIIEYLLI